MLRRPALILIIAALPLGACSKAEPNPAEEIRVRSAGIKVITQAYQQESRMRPLLEKDGTHLAFFLVSEQSLLVGLHDEKSWLTRVVDDTGKSLLHEGDPDRRTRVEPGGLFPEPVVSQNSRIMALGTHFSAPLLLPARQANWIEAEGYFTLGLAEKFDETRHKITLKEGTSFRVDDLRFTIKERTTAEPGQREYVSLYITMLLEGPVEKFRRMRFFNEEGGLLELYGGNRDVAHMNWAEKNQREDYYAFEKMPPETVIARVETCSEIKEARVPFKNRFSLGLKEARDPAPQPTAASSGSE
jgi:hypothetical protein